MVGGWRRAFCTSIAKEKSDNSSSSSSSSTSTKAEKHQSKGGGHSPRISSKLGFFSSPSTPRFHPQREASSHLQTSPNLRYPTPTPTPSSPNTPKPQPKPETTSSTPRQLFQYLSSNSSTTPPSTLSLINSTLHLSRNRCGICMRSVKNGEGTAIFTAECDHVFHFPCVTAHVKKRCPVCGSHWSESPVFSTNTNNRSRDRDDHRKLLRVYDDDEPLMPPSSPGGSLLFLPIPESQEFQPSFPTANAPKTTPQVAILPLSAVVSTRNSTQTRVVILKVRAPHPPPLSRPLTRLPVDLVALLDLADHVSGLKRAMAFIISSLQPTDRLSIVAFSSTSKRLLPLRRMTPSGKRSARMILDALSPTGRGMSVNDALKKAAKVIDDRREKNTLATVVVISHISGISSPTRVSTTRLLSRVEIPVHFLSLGESDPHDALPKCVGVVLTVMFRDVNLRLEFASGSAPAEISGVYPLTGRTDVFSPGSVRVGDLHPGEEKCFLVELKVPVSFTGSHHVLSVRPYFKEASTQETVACDEVSVLVSRPSSDRSSGIQRLKNVHVSTRAIAESRRVLEQAGDVSGAYRLLSSARDLLLQSADGSARDCLRGLEAELAELRRNCGVSFLDCQERRRRRLTPAVEEKPEALTPTSAWRAAERLAKVAIMRKHMNRVSDLHGFENARF